MKKAPYVYSMLLLAAIALLPFHAVADTINLKLTSAIQSGTPGSLINFYATAIAPRTNGGEVDLISDSYNVSGFGLPAPTQNAIDDTAFLTTFQYQYQPGDTYTGLLFTVQLPSNAAGLYTGYFEVFDGNNTQLANLIFNVNVPTASAVPEPSSWMLMATGAAGLLGFASFTRRGVFARSTI